MSLPGTDEYYTHLKTKYISGLVKYGTKKSVATAGQKTIYSSGSLKCSAVLETVDSAGTTYYIPMFAKSQT